jgi:hypothetical protein
MPAKNNLIKVRSARFAYSVKIGSKEVTFVSEQDFTLLFDKDLGVLIISSGPDTVYVFPTNVAYLQIV